MRLLFFCSPLLLPVPITHCRSHTFSPLPCCYHTWHLSHLSCKVLKRASSDAFRSRGTRTRTASTTASPVDSLVTCQATWWLKSPWTMSTSSTCSCSRASCLWTTRPQVSPLTSLAPCSWRVGSQLRSPWPFFLLFARELWGRKKKDPSEEIVLVGVGLSVKRRSLETCLNVTEETNKSVECNTLQACL